MIGVVELSHTLGERAEIIELAEVDLDVEELVEERGEHAVVDGLRARVLVDLLAGELAECLVGQLVHRGSDHCKAGRQRALLGQVVEGREKLATAEVARRAEDDHDGRVGDAVIVQPFR